MSNSPKYIYALAAPLIAEGKNYAEVCAALGWDTRNASSIQREMRKRGLASQSYGGRANTTERRRPDNRPDSTLPKTPEPKAPRPEKVITHQTPPDVFDEEKGTWKAVRVSSTLPQSNEELLDMFKVDRNVWEVSVWKCGGHDMGSIPRVTGSSDSGWERQDTTPVVTTLYKIEASFKRRVAFIAARADILALLGECKASRPLYAPLRPVAAQKGVLCVILTPEPHMGKLGWALQTGHDYDLRIATETYWDGLNRLMQRMMGRGLPIERFTFGCGNDLQNADNQAATTTRGTQQHNDGRMEKIFTGTRKMIHGSIEMLAEIAPVKTIMIGGNHDRNLNYCLGDALSFKYDGSGRVTVDNSPKARKYDRWYQNLHGFTHGDQQPVKDLPYQMSQDVREDWGQTLWAEWFTGHTHALKAQDSKGVIVRTISSISGTDQWHDEHGYTHNRRMWEAFLYDPQEGFLSHDVAAVMPI